MSNRIPRVSIGLPVYNGERFIYQALDSILTQDFEDFELIISDNASEDATYQMCRERASKDPRIRLYRNETNLGAVPNYNRLAGLARGQYFKWAAHDDWCAPQFLHRCVEVLDDDPSVVVSYPRTTLVEEDGTLVGVYEDPADASSSDPAERFLNLFWNLDLCNAILGLIRLDVLSQTRLIVNSFEGDKVLLTELALQGRLVQVPDPLFYRRLLGGSRMTRDARWWNTANQGRALLNRPLLYYHYLDVVMQSGISPRQKLKLGANVLGRFVAGARGRRRLRRAGAKLSGQSFRRHKS